LGRCSTADAVQTIIVGFVGWAFLGRSVLGLDVLVDKIPVIGWHASIDKVGGSFRSQEVVIEFITFMSLIVKDILLRTTATFLQIRVK
jgi:hypothetical protein